MTLLPQSTAASVVVGPVLDANDAFYAAGVPGDFSITVGGVTTALAGPDNTVAYIHNGLYLVGLTAGQLATLGEANLTINKANHAMTNHRYLVVSAAQFASLTNTGAVNVTKVGGTAVAGPDALKADVSGLASQSSVDLLSGRIPDALEGGRIKAVATLSTAGLATEATQLAILAQTSLIGTGSVSIQSPVNQTGELQTLIVGDAYQLAAGRAITINVLNVAAGLQTILSAGATVHLGFRSFGKSRQSPEFRRYEFAGTIVSVAATTVVRFELTTAQTKGILPGQYDYDIEFRQSGNYVTSVSNAEDVPMTWRESSTTLPA